MHLSAPALNQLSHGVVMTDAQNRIVFCNDRYLEIYGLARSDISGNMTGPELLEMRRKRGVLDVSVEDFYARAGTHYRTARRAVGSGQVFCAGERRFGCDARGLQRAAQAFEGAGIDQAVPGISTRQRAAMRGRQEHRGRPLYFCQ